MVGSELVKIAIISGASGMKGEVRLRLFVDDIDLFVKPTILFDRSSNRQFFIESIRQTGNNVIAKIEGIVDRSSAESLKNTELFAFSSALPPLDEGEFYHSQLLGLETRLKNGEKIGIITAIQNFGAGDVIEIKKDSGESEMLPLRAPWVEQINIEQQYIIITPAEYL